LKNQLTKYSGEYSGFIRDNAYVAITNMDIKTPIMEKNRKRPITLGEFGFGFSFISSILRLFLSSLSSFRSRLEGASVIYD